MLGRGKVRLPGAEVHKLRSLCAQLCGFRGYGHGGGDFNPPDTLRKK
jgi:hypothetical protein